MVRTIEMKRLSDCERREFLERMLAAGMLAAMPPIGGCLTRPASTLKFVNHSVVIGVERPFSVLHVTDSHLTLVDKADDECAMNQAPWRAKTFGFKQVEILEEMVAYAQREQLPLLHTGDLIDFHSRANLRYVREKFASHCALMCVGNHELSRYLEWEIGEWEQRIRSVEYREFCKLKAAPFYPFDLTFASRVIGGVNFVAFDDSLGWIPEAVFDRFEQEVKKGLPIVILVHMPLYAPETEALSLKMWGADAHLPGSPAWAQKYPKTFAFVERIRRERQVKAILAGDLHATIEERFSPTAMEYTLGGGFDHFAAKISFS